MSDSVVPYSDAVAVSPERVSACGDSQPLHSDVSAVNYVVSDVDSPLLLVLYSGDATDAGLTCVCVFSPR